MSDQHTLGQLHIAGRETRGLPHTLVAARTLLFRVYSEAYGDVEQETANARRLVASWNACEGVPIDLLELQEPLWGLAVADVITERQRQVRVEGWTPEHDDAHHPGELASAGGCYALFSRTHPGGMCPGEWPWAAAWWKPGDTRRNLVKAGALILAEIERIDRAAAKGGSA